MTRWICQEAKGLCSQQWQRTGEIAHNSNIKSPTPPRAKTSKLVSHLQNSKTDSKTIITTEMSFLLKDQQRNITKTRDKNHLSKTRDTQNTCEAKYKTYARHFKSNTISIEKPLVHTKLLISHKITILTESHK